MAQWLKVSNPSGFAGVSDATFVVDVENVTSWGFHRSGSSPNYVYRVTANGVVLEGDYALADDAYDAVLALTRANTLADYVTYAE